MWANKLELKLKLFSLRLAVQDPVKLLTQIFYALSFVDEPVKEEDHVVYLLSYNVLVTALEVNPNIPEFLIVTVFSLHEKKKISWSFHVWNLQCSRISHTHNSMLRRPRVVLPPKYNFTRR